MKNEEFLRLCKAKVAEYTNSHMDKTDGKQITVQDVYVVWSCKTLQNSKALLSTTVPDGMYYELTYNGDKHELYLDAYKKFQNMCFIKINNGKDSGQEKGGYEKGTSAKNLNFFICPVTTPIAVTKQDIMRIFDPTTNQKLNAWQMDYRRFHDMWILDNKLDSIYLSIQEAKV